jgi:hypothetical protein
MPGDHRINMDLAKIHDPENSRRILTTLASLSRTGVSGPSRSRV